MPAKRKAAAKKEPVEGTRRSTRSAPATADTTSGKKRKASPSPVPAKRAASTKKGRTQSPSPATENRKSSRGKQTVAQKEEIKPAAKAPSRSAATRGRVTRNVVQEVETKKTNVSKKPAETKKVSDAKKPIETKSRSSSRTAKPTTPIKQQTTPKRNASTPPQKAATPRGRSATQKEQKEAPKKVATPKKQQSPKQKTTPKRNTSPKKQTTPQITKKSAASKSESKMKKESPIRSSRSRRSKETEPDEKNNKDEPESKAEETEDTVLEDNAAEENSMSEKTTGSGDEKDACETEEEAKTTEEAKEDIKPEEEPETTVSENDEEVSEEIDEASNEAEEESMETEENEGSIENEKSEVKISDIEQNDSTECEEEQNKGEVNQKENAAINGDDNALIESTIDEESAAKDITASDSEENIGDAVLKPADITELKEDSEETPVEKTEPEIVNDTSNIDANAGGSGDQVIKDNGTINKSLADASKDDIQEIKTTDTETNGGQNTESVDNDDIQDINDNQGAAEENNTDSLVDNSLSKRKHEDCEEEDTSSSLKKPKIAAEEEIQENGAAPSSPCEDVAKDYVVIEMDDVPQPESSEVLKSLPNPLFNRPFIPNPAFSGSSDISKHFSIVSYNMLADCHLFRNDYSFTDAKYLASEYRLSKVIEELKYLDADIVCMQEVDPDYYSNQLLPSLKSQGYDGLFKKRTLDYYKEGEATFYKTNRFTLMKSTLSSFSELVEKELNGIEPATQEAVRNYMNLPDVVVITKLRCNNTGQEVTVGNVHIQWGEMKVPDAQCVQIASAVKEIVSHADGDVFPHIICGDFNSPPMSPGYLVARDGYPSGDETINKLMQIDNLVLPEEKKASLVNSLWPAFQHTSSSLRSAYSEAQGYESEVSSFNRVMCDCVDYIFYSSMSLDNIGVLQMASKERITETGGIPNCFFPSDHVSIKAKLSFK